MLEAAETSDMARRALEAIPGEASIQSKLESLSERHEEVGALLSDGEIIADQNRYRELAREYAELETVVLCFKHYQRVEGDLAEARLMLAPIAI